MAYVEDVSAHASVGLHDASDDVAFDQLALLLGSLAECGSGEAIKVAHGASGGLVEEADGLGGEEFAACLTEASWRSAARSRSTCAARQSATRRGHARDGPAT